MQNTVPETTTKLLALPLDIKTEGAPGTFEGYGAIFGNKDRDGDIVTHGAFAESLKAGMPVLLWQHDQKAPIGRFDEVREDEKGLFVKGRLALHGRGLEAYELLKMGALDGLSIGFVTKEASRDPATSTRTISKADLMEISLVTFPANELARVSTVKAAGFDEKGTDMPETDMPETDMLDADVNTARSFERMLRENGFSRSRAKTITAKGFKATDFAADETAEIAQIVAELKGKQERLDYKNLGSAAFDLFVNLVEAARTPINRVRLMPGQSKVFKVVPVKLGNVTFSIEAPSYLNFTCDIKYYDFNSRRPRRKTETLYANEHDTKTSVTVNRGRPPKFNPLKPDDWRKQFPEQLVLDSTEAKITYQKSHDKDLEKLPQRAAQFTLSTR
ncbi:MAG: HK97 family phage prohead protease [Kordiimonadaceae bacterium]|nr:HK97 family phage prohead protease [Kordiimonadaceae bacterium]